MIRNCAEVMPLAVDCRTAVNSAISCGVPGKPMLPFALLEFASGYGCLSRHLVKMTDRYDVLSCDIHPAAVEFIDRQIGLQATLSHSRPDQLKLRQQFSVVFALSFFSHILRAFT